MPTPHEETATGEGPGICLASALRVARLRRGWTRENLAHYSGLSWSAISQIETGRRAEVRVSSLVALAEALAVSLDYLVLASGEAPGEPMPLLEHRAFVYRTDAELAVFAGRFLPGPDDELGAALVVAPGRKLDLIRTELGPTGPLVECQASEVWYTTPDEVTERYRNFFRSARRAGATWVRVIGEPIWQGRSRADAAAWMRYESILNAIFSSWPVTMVCAYDERSAGKRVVEDALRTHPERAGREGSVPNATYEPPERFLGHH